MKITTTNFSVGDDGKKLMTLRLSLGFVDQYAVDGIDGFIVRLSQILPGFSFQGKGAKNAPGCGAGMAEIVARVALQLQALAGKPCSYWQVTDTGTAGNYDITFECSDETAAEYVARAAFRIVHAALYRQRYSLSPDLNMLQNMAKTSGNTQFRKKEDSIFMH